MPRSYLKDAVRQRAERTSASYQKTLQALTRFDRPRPEQPFNPAGIDWSPLYGVEATFANDHHQLRGVVLPPDGVRNARDVLRVAVTSPHDGPGPAEVTYLDARWWRVDPMPDRVDERFLPSRRRTRGERGLPLYRSDNLPAAALATRTMLDRQYRMRVADGQAPVAEYFSMRDYTDLYAIDDAECLPELSPARKAAWDKVRTCARCGHHRRTPYRKASDSHRYCETCWSLAADDWWTSQLDRAQQLATSWARSVVTDPNAVIANCSGWPFARFTVVEIITGEVLHDLTTMLLPRADDAMRRTWRIEDHDPRWEGCIPLPEVAEIMTTLADRRIISWTSGLEPIARRLLETGVLSSPGEGHLATIAAAWTHTDSDSARRWYGYWLNEPDYQPTGTPRWAAGWNTSVTLRCLNRDVPENASTGENLRRQTMDDLAALQRMAAGQPTQAHRDQARSAPARSATMSVYSSAITEFLAEAAARLRMRYTGETYEQAADGIRDVTTA